MRTLVDTNDLKERFRRLIGNSKSTWNPNTYSKAIDYFVNSYVISRLLNMSTDHSNLEKLCLNDPTVFWSLYKNDIDLNDENNMATVQGHLLEHIVISHLKRMERGMQVKFFNDGVREVDSIFKLEGKTFFIQVERAEGEAKKDLQIAQFVADLMKIKTFNISLVLKLEEIKLEKNGVIMPASLFMAFI